MVPLVYLHQSPADRGEALGRAQETMLKAAAEEFKQRCQRGGVNLADLPDRARQLTMLVNSLVPEWVIEARATAAGAGMPVATYLSMSSTPNVTHGELAGPAGDGSTAFAASGAACQGPVAVLHLNRDGRRMPQFVFSRASSPGTLAYVALSGGAELGIHAFANEGGLAGCWQSGPPIKDYGNGLSPMIFLRAVCERSVTCRQGLAFIAELQTRYGLYTPGDRGVTFLLADAAGEVLHVEANAMRHAAVFMREGLVVAANQFQLPDSPGGPQSRDVPRQRRLRDFLFSRRVEPLCVLPAARLTGSGEERGVCNPQTVAAFTAVLGAQGTPPLVLATIGPPSCMRPVALFPSLGVPLPMLDGSLWSVSEALVQRFVPGGVKPALHAAYDEKWAALLAPAAAGGWDDAAREALVQTTFQQLLEFVDDASAPE